MPTSYGRPLIGSSAYLISGNKSLPSACLPVQAKAPKPEPAGHR